MSSQFNATDDSSLATDVEQNTNLRLSKEEVDFLKRHSTNRSILESSRDVKDQQLLRTSKNSRLEYSSSES